MSQKQPTPSKLRSAAGNDPSRLTGADGNLASVRRYRDIVNSLVEELGGDLTEIEILRVRTAAGLLLAGEELTGRLARGEPVAPDDIVRAANSADRMLRTLKRAKAPTRRRRGHVAGPHPLAREATA